MVKLLKSIRRKINDYVFRFRYGFWPVEWFDFFSGCSRYVLPRLEYLRDHTRSIPMTFIHNYELEHPTKEPRISEDGEDRMLTEWHNAIDSMVVAFRLMDGSSLTYTADEEKQISTGMQNFGMYYLDLWD